MIPLIAFLLGFSGQPEVQAPPIVLPPYAPPPVLAPSRPPVITAPQWTRRPDGADLERYFPSMARDWLVNGKAVIECTVVANGTVAGCVARSETPRGWGFGEATVRASSKFRMRPRTIDGAPVEGAQVRITLIWKIENSVTLLCTDVPAETRTCAVDASEAEFPIERRGFDLFAKRAISGREPSPAEKRPATPGYFLWTVPIDPPIVDCPAFDGEPNCGGPGAIRGGPRLP